MMFSLCSADAHFPSLKHEHSVADLFERVRGFFIGGVLAGIPKAEGAVNTMISYRGAAVPSRSKREDE
jgi:hypothetical protein